MLLVIFGGSLEDMTAMKTQPEGVGKLGTYVSGIESKILSTGPDRGSRVRGNFNEHTSHHAA